MKEYYIAQNSESPWPDGGGKTFASREAAIDFLFEKENMGCDSVITVTIKPGMVSKS